MAKQSEPATSGALPPPAEGGPEVNPWIDPGQEDAFFQNAEIRALRDRATEFARAGVPVNFSGPAGLGKTSLAFQVARALDRPVSVMTGNMWLSASDFIGGQIGTTSTTVVDKYVQSVHRTERQTRTDWGSSVLARAMQYGHTLIYDEFTRASPEANATLLSVLEEGLLICTDPAGPQRHIRAHPRFRALLTSNPHDYAAVNSAPDALLDRVVTLDLPEYSAETLAQIVTCRTGLEAGLARRLVGLILVLRGPGGGQTYSALRSAILAGRVVAFRAALRPLAEADLADIASLVLRGRGTPVTPQAAQDALTQTRAA